MPDPATDSNRSLRAYGTLTRPRVEKRQSVDLGPRTIGFIGRDVARERTVYVSEREAEDHRYHGDDYRYNLPFAGDGHGLSLDAFSHLYENDVGLVLIAETDTGDVYEYAFSQFVDGHPINVADDGTAAHPERGYEKDPQKVLPLSAAVHVYEDHADTYRARVTGYD